MGMKLRLNISYQQVLYLGRYVTAATHSSYHSYYYQHYYYYFNN